MFRCQISPTWQPFIRRSSAANWHHPPLTSSNHMSEKQSSYLSASDVEKDATGGSVVNTTVVQEHDDSPLEPVEEDEVFKSTADGENYRTVSW